MFKFSALSQIWKKYTQKLNAWDLSLRIYYLCKGLCQNHQTILDNSKKKWKFSFDRRTMDGDNAHLSLRIVWIKRYK